MKILKFLQQKGLSPDEIKWVVETLTMYSDIKWKRKLRDKQNLSKQKAVDTLNDSYIKHCLKMTHQPITRQTIKAKRESLQAFRALQKLRKDVYNVAEKETAELDAMYNIAEVADGNLTRLAASARGGSLLDGSNGASSCCRKGNRLCKCRAKSDLAGGEIREAQ